MKFVNSMLVAAYLLIVGLTAWSLVQNFGIKEVSVEAEIEDILAVDCRSKINCTLLCRYSYNGREYEEKVSRNSSCRKGDKINIVIDADHPDTVIEFSKRKRSKAIFLSVLLGIMAVFAIVLLIKAFRHKE
ncbi:hypothetical protein NE644_08665 [Blautia wexlerae]|uniref:hypothetical protein n=1 Tax=Blautia wexlerae TaxID=418240 RepID=UPI00210E3F25|nr:hypothetical protein [Blautia wexlerae]MCQ5297523.1 hypothetical protein [Blautia wexlerae]